MDLVPITMEGTPSLFEILWMVFGAFSKYYGEYSEQKVNTYTGGKTASWASSSANAAWEEKY